MKALVIGATGAVGKDLVQQLIDDSYVERDHIYHLTDPVKPKLEVM